MICYPLDNTAYLANALGAYNATRTRGVFCADDNFDITFNGMTTTIGAGLAWLKVARFWGVSALLDEPVEISLDAGDGLLGRIDIVLVSLDKELNKANVIVRKGIPASTPSYIDPVRDDTADEIYLYAISVPAGCTEITSAHITDLRNDETVCGVMRDGITGLPTAQIQAQASALITSLQDEINAIEQGSAVMLASVYAGETEGYVANADHATTADSATSAMPITGGAFTGNITVPNAVMIGENGIVDNYRSSDGVKACRVRADRVEVVNYEGTDFAPLLCSDVNCYQANINGSPVMTKAGGTFTGNISVPSAVMIGENGVVDSYLATDGNKVCRVRTNVAHVTNPEGTDFAPIVASQFYVGDKPAATKEWAMPKTGGTFTGIVVAGYANTTGTNVRNTIVRDANGTDVPSTTLIFYRK